MSSRRIIINPYSYDHVTASSDYDDDIMIIKAVGEFTNATIWDGGCIEGGMITVKTNDYQLEFSGYRLQIDRWKKYRDVWLTTYSHSCPTWRDEHRPRLRYESSLAPHPNYARSHSTIRHTLLPWKSICAKPVKVFLWCLYMHMNVFTYYTIYECTHK